jgi:hypothetical protein
MLITSSSPAENIIGMSGWNATEVTLSTCPFSNVNKHYLV